MTGRAVSNNPHFNWDTDPRVVAHKQMAIAVEPRGGYVILTQDDSHYDDVNAMIEIAPENAVAVANAILKAARALGVEIDQALARPKDLTAAERQRRHRDKNKNRDVTASKRDGHEPFPLKVVGHE